MTELTRDEDVRVRQLLDAQAKAADLFRAVEEGSRWPCPGDQGAKL